MIHDERARSADMLESLSPEQWTADTLCQGWNVHVVAAHMMIAGEQTTGRFSRVSSPAISLQRHDGPWRLVTGPDCRPVRSSRESGREQRPLINHRRPRWRCSAKSWSTALFRQPLGIPDDTSSDAKLACLKHVQGLQPSGRGEKDHCRTSTRATDADWSHGSGPEVAGPMVALLMAMATRPLMDSLSGDGVDILRGRLTK